MKKLFITFIILLSIGNLNAGQKYQSKFLKYLYEQAIEKKIFSFPTKTVSIDTIGSHYVFHIQNKNFSKGILVEFTKDTILSQIGLNILDSSLREMYPGLIKFTERYFFGKLFNIKLNKYFSNEMSKILCSFKGNSVKNWNDPELKHFLENISHIQFDYSIKEISISLSDSLKRTVELILPQNINLIMGMDKKELDDYVYTVIRSGHICNVREKKNEYLGDKLLKYNDIIFYSEGKQLYKGLDQSCYFDNVNGKYKLLLDPKYPLISIKNILLNPTLKQIDLKVEHHLYGKDVKNYEITYERLFNCLAANNQIFSGFESSTSDSLKYLVVFFDESALNSHLISLVLPKNILNNDKPVLGRAVIYTNIRSDNIKYIFKKYKEGKKIIKYELSD